MAGEVSVDARELIQRFQAFSNPANLTELVELMAHYARATWRRAVSGEVLEGMTRPVYSDSYAQAIDDPSNTHVLSNDQVEIDLSSLPEAVRIENGAPAYDMKPGLLKGRSYVDIPFRHGTPASKRDGPNPKRAGPGFATTMSPLMYRMAKELRASPGGDALEDDAPPITKPKMGGMRKAYTHKTSLHNGMRRYEGQDGDGTNGSRYLTFRRIGKRSAQESWWMPAQEPNPVSEAVAASVDKQMPNLVAAYVKVLLEGI